MDVLVRTTMISVCRGKLDRSDAWRHIHRCKRQGSSKDVAGRTVAPPQGLNVNNLLLRPRTAPQRYFFPSLLKGFQKALLADKIVAAFVRSTVLLLASATWMDHGWPYRFTFVLYPVQFILHRNYAMWSE